MIQLIKIFINGVVFGLVQLVPGVSAGTIAIILGFYNQLIEAINHFREDYKRHLKFILPLGLGVVSGLVAFSSVIEFILIHYPFPSIMFFIGLIVGVVPNIFSQVKASKERLSLRDMLLILIPCAVVLAISLPNFGAGGAGADVYVGLSMMLYIFVVGVIAAASLLIPGLSGSFILLIAGIYPLAINAVSSIRILITDIGNLEPLFNIVRVLGPLGTGVIIGILLTARLIEKLLKSRQKEVYQVVLGLLSGSVIVLVINHALIHTGDGPLILIIGLACLVIGFFVPYKLNAGKFDILQKLS